MKSSTFASVFRTSEPPCPFGPGRRHPAPHSFRIPTHVQCVRFPAAAYASRIPRVVHPPARIRPRPTVAAAAPLRHSSQLDRSGVGRVRTRANNPTRWLETNPRAAATIAFGGRRTGRCYTAAARTHTRSTRRLRLGPRYRCAAAPVYHYRAPYTRVIQSALRRPFCRPKIRTHRYLERSSVRTYIVDKRYYRDLRTLGTTI